VVLSGVGNTGVLVVPAVTSRISRLMMSVLESCHYSSYCGAYVRVDGAYVRLESCHYSSYCVPIVATYIVPIVAYSSYIRTC
jgi:hypothetical protein